MRSKRFLILVILVTVLSGCTARAQPPQYRYPAEAVINSLPPVDAAANLHLFNYDAAAPLDVQLVKSWRDGPATWQDITYASPKGGRVTATLVIPDGRGPFPGLVIMHGGGAKSTRQDMSDLARGYAVLGAAVITVDAPFARPGGPVRPPLCAPLFLDARDRTEQVQLIIDLRRAFDLLAARPDVDPNRLAYVGYSYGGGLGGLLAGVEHRPRAYVLVVGDGGRVEHLAGPDDAGQPEGPFFRISDEVQQRWLEAMWPVEPLHYVGMAAPAALLFQNGTRDVSVPPYDAIRYQQAGSEPKTIMWYASGHELPDQAWRDQATWLHRYIGGSPLPLVPIYSGSAAANWALMTWYLLGIMALGFVIWDVGWRRRERLGSRIVWPLATLLLGPIGLAVYLIAGRDRAQGGGDRGAAPAATRALASAVLGLIPALLGVVVADVAIVALAFPAVGLQLALIYLLPLATVALVFVVVRVGRADPGRSMTVGRSRFAAHVSNTATLIGMNTVIVGWLNGWFPFGLGSLHPALWTVVILAALAGFVTTYPAHLWMVARGIIRTPVAAGEADLAAVRRARVTWYEATGVILLCHVGLVFGLLLGLALATRMPLGQLLSLLAGRG